MSGSVLIPDKATAKALNNLARHQAIVKLLYDVRMDMEICEIEGWDKMEFIGMIRAALPCEGGLNNAKNN